MHPGLNIPESILPFALHPIVPTASRFGLPRGQILDSHAAG
jgi:hypothetical protein